jgi:hypothetical protein
MNFLQYKDFDDFLLKTGMAPEEARKFLFSECEKRGII